MDLTLPQIESLAPDPGSVSAARKLGARSHWQGLGRSDDALWGQCKGSALYQVRVDLADLGSKCSCPSRKFPCKHALGLLMLAATEPAAAPFGEPPEWVIDWIGKRRERTAKRELPPEEAKPADAAAAAKRAAKRDQRVRDGIDRLQLWMADLVRNGIAGLDAAPPKFWEEQAARLVDAQAPGLAARVRHMGTLPGESRDWPQRLLMDLGRLQLLLRAYERLESLDPVLQSDVRQLVGWNVPQDELERDGERALDDWIVFGQRDDFEDRLRVQRSWLVGRHTGRIAMLLQFAAGGAPFAESIVPGTRQQAELVFYPGTFPQRAKILKRIDTAPVNGPLPAAKPIAAVLEDVAQALARNPWIERFGVVLSGVTPVVDQSRWYARDAAGQALPLHGEDHWRLLALSGALPLDLGAEWDGHRLRPLGTVVNDRFCIV